MKYNSQRSRRTIKKNHQKFPLKSRTFAKGPLAFLILTALLSGQLGYGVGVRAEGLTGKTEKSRIADKNVLGEQPLDGKFAKSSKSLSPAVAEPVPTTTPEPEPTPERKFASSATQRSAEIYGPFDFERFLEREKAGEFPYQGGFVEPISPLNSLTNNNGGATGTSLFTQSETSITAFGNNVVIGFNDSGSNAGGTNKFTGWAYSNDGGNTFTDGGTLPTSAVGDAGDPVLARDEVTGRIYLSTLGFSGAGTIQMWRSDTNGVSWMAPVNATPGGSSEDKQWHTVDNFAGPGQGNVYVLSRRFGTGPGIYFFRSTDGGATFGPNGGTLIVGGSQGAFIAVGPDHSIYAFWYAGATLQVRKSTDQGLTFGAPVTVVSGLVGGTNGDLSLTGRRQGTASFSGFRSNEFPHAVVNPATGHIYATFANNPAGTDKADIFMVQSTDGGATWSPAVRVNDDATTTDQWQPTLAVSPDGSRLGIFYYSRQEDPVDNNLFKYYGRIATLAGPTVSFLPSFAISDEASLPEFGRDSLINAVYMGDYDHAAATPGFFHVVWSDNRSNLAGGGDRKDPNVYYKKIPLGLAVSSTVPQVGSILSTQPTQFTVNVTDPIDPAGLSPGDFTVNGIPADAFGYGGGTSIIFSFNSSPVTSQGLQTMSVAAGAFTRLSDGDPVLEFTGTFRYDVVALQVQSTSPPFPNGFFLLPGPLTYDVTFNEPINLGSVQASDLQLGGIAGSTVTGAEVLGDNLTVRFTLDIPNEGIINASIPAGTITDSFGNPGAAFAAAYSVDAGTQSFPTPLLAKVPHGSLIYDPTAGGTIGSAGDTDIFTIAIDPGQTVTLVVKPTTAGLQPSVTLRNPANDAIGSSAAAGANQTAVLNTAPALTGGNYSIVVGGANDTTGDYSIQLILNSAQELEGTITGATNNSAGTAQDINGSFITLQTPVGSFHRGAATGTVDSAPYTAQAVPGTFEDISATGTVIAGLTNVDDAAVSIPIGFSFPFYGADQTNVFVSSNGLMTFGAGNTAFSNADLTTTPSQAAIAPFWDDQHTGGGAPDSGVRFQVLGTPGVDQRLVVQWNKVRFFAGGTAGDTITYQAVLFADGRVQFNYPDIVSGTAGGNNGGSATVGQKAAGPQGADRLLLAFNNGPNAFVGTGKSTLVSPPAPPVDLFSFALSSGDKVSLAVKGTLAGLPSVELVNSGGTVVASGVGGSANLDSVISNYAVGSSGTYYARVGGVPSSAYNLVVTRNGAFDTENNNTLETAQPMGGSRGALGSIQTSSLYAAEALSPEFEDISATGTVIAGLTNVDDAAVSIPIGFSFPFYGADQTNVFVSSNGLMTFGAGNTAFSNADLTTTPSQAAIAPFWDDQHTGGGAADSNVFFQVLGAGADERLVVQWNKVRFFAGGTAGDTITYQAVLFADGRVRFNYPDVVSGSAGGNNGASASVGQKAAGTQGADRLLLAFNNGPNAFVGTGKSSQISPQTSDDWYSITLDADQSRLQLATGTPADGPGEFVNTLDPHIELYDGAGNLVAAGIAAGDGRNETLLANGLTFGGTYFIRVSSEGDSTGEYFLTTGVYNFGGFIQPISGTALNTVNAGATVSVKFSLGGYEGLDILSPGSPVSRPINCSTFVPTGPEVSTQPTNKTGLSFDQLANQYIYRWDTVKSWKNTCRELNVKLIDGTDHTARFRFK